MKLGWKIYSKRRFGIFFVSFLMLFELLPGIMPSAAAGTLTNTFVLFNSIQTSTATGGTVCAKPASAGTVANVAVTFPTGFTLGAAATWTTTTTPNTDWPSGANAWLGIGTATGVSSQTVTFPSSNLVVGTLYCFNWNLTTAVTTPSSANPNLTGTVATETSGLATIDSGSFATQIVTNDQVSVTATVSPSFQVTFNNGSLDQLFALSNTSVASSNTVTFTVNSNAKNGWMAWVSDANSGLKSPTLSYTIPSTTVPGVGSTAAAITAGTEATNLGVAYAQSSGTCSSGSAVPSTFLNTSGQGGSFNTGFLPILSCGGTTSGGTVTPTNYASIKGSTPAATDYADTETFVAAGIF